MAQQFEVIVGRFPKVATYFCLHNIDAQCLLYLIAMLPSVSSLDSLAKAFLKFLAYFLRLAGRAFSASPESLRRTRKTSDLLDPVPARDCIGFLRGASVTQRNFSGSFNDRMQTERLRLCHPLLSS